MAVFEESVSTMRTTGQWVCTAVLAGTLGLAATLASASAWEGQFHTPYKDNKGNPISWVFTIRCSAESECLMASASMKDGKTISKDVLPATPPAPLLPEPQMVGQLRIATRLAIDSPEPLTGPDYYRAEIYPQIGSPDRVVECRAGTNLPVVICRLDKELLDAGGGRRSAWIVLIADLASGTGCPAMSWCPGVLTKR